MKKNIFLCLNTNSEMNHIFYHKQEDESLIYKNKNLLFILNIFYVI